MQIQFASSLELLFAIFLKQEVLDIDFFKSQGISFDFLQIIFVKIKV